MLLNPTNLCNQNSTKNFLQRVFIAESLIYACSLLLLNAICFNPINLIIYLWTWYLKLASRFSVKWVEEYEKLDFPTYFNREGEEKNTGTIPLVSLLPMVKMRIKEWTQFFFRNRCHSWRQCPRNQQGCQTTTEWGTQQQLGTGKSCLCKSCMLYYWWVYHLPVGNL